jgi:hypothetical protein
MDIIIKADKYLNGNHPILNIIFSYLGQSPSAKVLNELLFDKDLNEVVLGGFFGDAFPRTYFNMRRYGFGYSRMPMKKYTPLNIPRLKLELYPNEDDILCERCTDLLTDTDRDFYDGYCESCYYKVHHLGNNSDDEQSDLDTDTDTDEYE